MSRVVRFLGRTKAYITECKESMAPLPNPEWYEKEKHLRVTFRNLRKIPLSVHTEIWRSTWKWYLGSFGDLFAWSRKRKERARRKEAEDKISILKGVIKDAREATHNSPEDLERSKEALKELLKEIHDNQDELKSAAQEKLDLIRLSLSEFSAGYRASRDEEFKRVMAMDESVLKSFLNERVGEVKHAASVISNAIVDKDAAGGEVRGRGGGKNAATPNNGHGPRPDNSAAGAAAAGHGGPGTMTKSTTSASAATGGKEGVDGYTDLHPEIGADYDDNAVTGPSRFLSQRTRQAVDDVLRDPDLERLAGRAKGFGRERLLAAEAAARILKGEEEGVGGGRRRQRPGVGVEGGEKGGSDAGKVGNGEEAPQARGQSASETPIISGLVSEASGFLTQRVGQAKEGGRDVVEAVMDARRARQNAAAAAAAAADAERSDKPTTPEEGGQETAREGDGAKGVGKS